MVEDEDISQRVTDCLVISVNKDRRVELVSLPLVRSIASLLQQLSSSSYDKLFIKPFLSASHTFYREEATRHVIESDSSTYLKEVHRRLQEESEDE